MRIRVLACSVGVAALALGALSLRLGPRAEADAASLESLKFTNFESTTFKDASATFHSSLECGAVSVASFDDVDTGKLAHAKSYEATKFTLDGKEAKPKPFLIELRVTDPTGAVIQRVIRAYKGRFIARVDASLGDAQKVTVLATQDDGKPAQVLAEPPK
jgi:hypothetical protein